ncbi:MAG TPA: ATP-binding protein, partial [Thermoanaerobaculia bacterium]|nr:ATP-binding protein [Thermoanaerobaculia bacterium]
IDSVEIGKIFDEFYQVTERGPRRKGGTGLGLSLTRSFIEMHQGTIEVASEPGRGSTFIIHLPADLRDIAPHGEWTPPRRQGVAQREAQ